MQAALPALDPSRAVAYRRVSSADQVAETGPERQRRKIADFAKREGIAIVGDVFEDRSGTLPIDDRPGLRQALADALRLGAGTLIVEDRSRLARDEYAAHDAKRAFAVSNVRVLYADGSNGEGEGAELIDSIQHALAAHDRRGIVARLRAGREVAADEYPDARKQGGPVPFGYRRTRDGLDVDRDAAETVRQIFDLARSGSSLAKIADAIERTGAPRSRSALAELIRNETYKRESEGGRIVDPRVWNAAQTALDRRRKRPSAATLSFEPRE